VNLVARLVAIIAALLVALTWLAVRGTYPGSARHEEMLGALQTLSIGQSTLHRDILRARAGLLRNYDPLVRATDALRDAAGLVQRLDADAAMQPPVLRLLAALQAQEDLVERFKSRNALLRNSLNYFGYAVLGLDDNGQGGVAAAARDLAAQMLRFIGNARPDNAAAATASLDRLATAGADRQDVASVVEHSRLILATLPAVDALVASLLQPGVTELVRAVQGAYLRQHASALERANLFRLLLYGAAVLLVGYLAWLFVRLEAYARRLRRTQRLEAIGALAGGVAHNFNNILGAVLGYSEMALERLAPDSPSGRYVAEVRQAGLRAKSLVDQMLTFGRQTEHARHPMRLSAAVREAVRLLHASLPTVSIGTDIGADAETATVSADAAQLQQVVMNLCTNAAHAMDGRGTIDLRLDVVEFARRQVLSHGRLAAGRYVRLAVRDTGHGIDPAMLEHIFEPFFTTKPAGRGTGLGLSSVHGIIAECGGALNVLSTPGHGSTFEAYLAATGWTSGAAGEFDAAPLPRGAGETILLVEDDRRLMLLGEEMVAALGYEPVGFDDGPAALASFRAAPARFDLLLTDAVMPHIGGLELAAAVHRIRPDLPVLLVTGHGAPPSPEAVQAAGVRQVLRKPLLSEDLARALARHLAATRPG
jgi:signal transduction histidine kinase/ActR/RegA family two-component response regulator